MNRALLTAALTTAALLSAGQAHALNLTYSGTDKWEVETNWNPALIPIDVDSVVIDGIDGDSGHVTFDTDTWVFLTDNGYLNSPTEYRINLLRICNFGTDSALFDFGDDNTIRTTNAGVTYIGSGSGSNGTLTLLSGQIIAESARSYIGEKENANGLLDIQGGSYTSGREQGGNSLWVGDEGSGTLQISGGSYFSRAGVVLGGNGVFDVIGTGPDSIGIGSYNSVDGKWTQEGRGLLRFGIESEGATSIFVDDVDDNGGGDVIFDSGAVLEPYDLGDALEDTWYTVMTWDGTLTDNGLLLSDDAVDAGWEFQFAGNELQVMLAGAVVVLPGDANGDGKVDLLDLSILASNFQGTDTPYDFSQGDFTNDGVVDLLDLSVLASNFGTDTTVPEPAAVALLALGAVSLTRRQSA